MAEYRIHALYALLDELKTADALLRDDLKYFEREVAKDTAFLRSGDPLQLPRSPIHEVSREAAESFEEWCDPRLLRLLDDYAKNAPNFEIRNNKLERAQRKGLRNRHLGRNTKFLVMQAWDVVLGHVSAEEAVRTAKKVTGRRVPVAAVESALGAHADKEIETKVKDVFLALSAGEALHQDKARQGVRGELRKLIIGIGTRFRARHRTTDTGALPDVSKDSVALESRCPTPDNRPSPGAVSTRRKKSKSK